MSQANVEIIERLIVVFNAKKVDEFAELTTSDFKWAPSMMAVEGEMFVGREGIETYMSRIIDGWDSFRTEEYELRDLGDRVLLSGRLEGRGRMSGASVSAAIDILFDLRGGQVSSMRSFLDHGEALQAAGLEE